MNIPIVVLPHSIKKLLDEKNPDQFELEEMAHLFGILIPGRLDGREMIVLTHAYRARGIFRSFANVNTNERGVRDSLQIINNGLTITSSVLGLAGSTVGTWHTHPSSPNTGPSYDDVNTYRESARISGLGFWLGPIACRRASGKYTKWLFYEAPSDRVLELPEENIVIGEDGEVSKLGPGLERFLRIKPEHFLSDVRDVESVWSGLPRNIKPSVPLCTDAMLAPSEKPRRILNNIYASAVSTLRRIQWFEVMVISSFCATVILYALFALYLSK